MGVAIVLIRDAIKQDFSYNPFNINDGFGTLLFTWDFKNAEYTTVFGITLLKDWPKFSNEPHFVTEAIASYVAVPAIVVGGLWYIVVAQAYLARTIKAYKLSKTVFEKSLDNYNQNTTIPPNNDTFGNNN